MNVIGIDVGGTKIESVLFETGGRPSRTERYKADLLSGKDIYLSVRDRIRVSTEREQGYVSMLQKVAQSIRKMCEKASLHVKDIDGIGIGLPGAVDPIEQSMIMGNTIAFVGKKIRDDLAKKLSYKGPVYCENDANCFAYAESLCGVGRDYAKKFMVPIEKQISLGIILGTGVGGGIIVNGKIVSGRGGGAGEIGHTQLHSRGAPCYCGRDGCAEQYLSGPAIEAMFASRIYHQIRERPSSQEIFEVLYKNLDPIAIAVVKRYKRDLAKFIGNISNVLDPHYIVFGGGVSRQQEIYDDLQEKVLSHRFISGKGPQIYKHKIGDAAGALGAALLCI